jgi:hypothetical protein
MSSVILRRCSGSPKSKSLYDNVVEEAEAQRDSHLAAHTLDQTFFRSPPDYRGNINFQKADGTPFMVNFIAEIGTLEQGTWLAAYPKNPPPAYKLVSLNNLFIRCSDKL